MYIYIYTHCFNKIIPFISLKTISIDSVHLYPPRLVGSSGILRSNDLGENAYDIAARQGFNSLCLGPAAVGERSGVFDVANPGEN